MISFSVHAPFFRSMRQRCFGSNENRSVPASKKWKKRRPLNERKLGSRMSVPMNTLVSYFQLWPRSSDERTCSRVFADAKCVSDVRQPKYSRPSCSTRPTLLFDASTGFASAGRFLPGTTKRGVPSTGAYSTDVSTFQSAGSSLGVDGPHAASRATNTAGHQRMAR